MKKRLAMMLLCVMVSVTAALAQAITGTVVSALDGEPIIGATVKIKGTAQGTVTDMDGKFTVNGAGKTLVFSYVGMLTKELPARNGMKVTLEGDDNTLDEVMVVAFGTAKKSAFTGSAKVVGSEAISLSQVSAVTSALAGAVPGVTLTSSNGAPGSSPTIRIRGFSSINAGKDPLIIVDGAPYSGDMTNINPNDVETMTVLKDAASSALYGARGANGVIIITTKQAKRGTPTNITVDAKWGGNTQALQHYDVIKNPAEYYEMHYKAFKNYYMNAEGMSEEQAWHQANATFVGSPDDGGLGYNIYTVPAGQYLIGQDGRLNPNATLGNIVNYGGKSYLITPDNWENEGTRTGLRQEYNVSVNGSTDRMNFYLSAGYLDNQGITAASDHKRFTTRMRADYQATKWLKLGGNMSYVRFDGNTLSDNGESTSTGNIWAVTTQIAPVYPLYWRYSDGSKVVDDNGIIRMDYGNGTYAGLDRAYLQDANPIQDNLLNTRNYEGNQSTGNGFVDVTFCPGLVFTLNASYYLDETRTTTILNKYYGQFDSSGGIVEKSHNRTYSYNIQQLLNYTHTFGDVHNFNLMLGHEYYDYTYRTIGASKSKMFSDENLELDGAVVDGKGSYSYKERYNNEGYFGRLQYDYDSKYFGSLSYRRDASSRFDVDNRWGSFWSAGGAWIISKEKWYDVKWLDMLKLKASIGSQGNDNIGDYRYTDRYIISNSNDKVGTSFDLKGQKDITWETQTNFNAGVEFSLFNRVNVSAEYYFRKTADMLIAFTTPPSIGYTSYYSNVGDLHNTGVEVDVQANLYHNKNVDWNVNFNISSINNEITSLDEDTKTASYYTSSGKEVKGFTSGSFFIAEGQSIYTWRLREFAGVYGENTYQLTGDTQYDPSKGGLSMWYKNTFDATTKEWTGRTATTTLSEADYYVTEKTTVPKWQGGFGTSVKFYGFDFAINCSFQLGGKGYDSSYADFMSSPTSASAGSNYHKDLYKAWTVGNQNTDVPRLQFDDVYTVSASTRFLTNASYLNIENINFGYTFPAKWTRKAEINSLRVYVACENVAYFSARKGFDPRQTYSDYSNVTRYSPMRTISGGITVQF